MRRLAPGLVVALVLAGCGSTAPRQALPQHGPAGVVRVGLTEVRWPLDPAFVEGRDDETIARAAFATPLRTDSASGALRPGLCATWATTNAGLTWRFRCRHAVGVGAALERMRALPSAPSGWLFAPIERVRRVGSTVAVKLRFRWMRFPYVLTTVAASPRSVPGPFRVVKRGRGRIELRRRDLALVFSRVNPSQGVRAFRRGELDDAPVPAGDLRRLQLDPQLGSAVRTRRLLAVDLVAFGLRTGALAGLSHTRRVYWRTAARGDYAELVPEGAAPPAFALGGTGGATATGALRAARRAVPSLPPVAVPILTRADEDSVHAAQILFAGWRELGLGPTLVPTRRFETRRAAGGTAWFDRELAAYPRSEAIAAALLLPQDGRNPWLAAPSRARTLLLRALAHPGRAALARVDSALRADAAVVPVAGVVGARLVSPRLAGWAQDARGVVDYSAVRFPAQTRRR